MLCMCRYFLFHLTVLPVVERPFDLAKSILGLFQHFAHLLLSIRVTGVEIDFSSSIHQILCVPTYDYSILNNVSAVSCICLIMKFFVLQIHMLID